MVKRPTISPRILAPASLTRKVIGTESSTAWTSFGLGIIIGFFIVAGLSLPLFIPWQ